MDIERGRRNSPSADIPASVRKIRALEVERRRARVISFDEMWTYVGVKNTVAHSG